MIEIVYDGQDHHEDCMYPTYADPPESCTCAELLREEAWPQDEDEDAA
ncbi:hypothetical protein [Streptomyces sp. NBC_01237]|nr:hypothetical protein [Streptomyces sp. NBC_01237]WRZ76412.1 hypothetical protein OG251_34995 [Streptomyces sp. NBC_01237]